MKLICGNKNKNIIKCFKLSKFAILLTPILFSLNAKTDILFLDLNDAPGEIKSARQAAEARGEKLIVIPNENQKKQVTLAQIKKELNAYKASSSGVSFEGFTSIVISGHDGYGAFSGSRKGEQFYSDIENFQEIFKENKSLFKNTRSVSLWGCRTTNMGSVASYWQNSGLPEDIVFAGFDDSGPSKTREANHQYLSTFLLNDKELNRAKKETEVAEVMKKIKGFNLTNASICSSKFFIDKVNGKLRIQNYEHLENECDLRKQINLKKQIEEMNCAYNRPKECPMNNERYDRLNNLSEVLRSKAICRGYWEQQEQERGGINVLPTITLERMLQYGNLLDKLRDLHQNDLTIFDQDLKTLGAPSSIRLSNISNLKNREQVREKLRELHDFLSEFKNDKSINDSAYDFYLGDPEKAAAIIRLKAVNTELRDMLDSLSKTEEMIDWHLSEKSESKSRLLSFYAAKEGHENSMAEVQINQLDRKINSFVEEKIEQLKSDPGSSTAKKLTELEQLTEKCDKTVDQHQQFVCNEKKLKLDKEIRTPLRKQAFDQLPKPSLNNDASKRYLNDCRRNIQEGRDCVQ